MTVNVWILDTDHVSLYLRSSTARACDRAKRVAERWGREEGLFVVPDTTAYEIARGLRKGGSKDRVRRFEAWARHSTYRAAVAQGAWWSAAGLWAAGRKSGVTVNSDIDVLQIAIAVDWARPTNRTVLVTGDRVLRNLAAVQNPPVLTEDWSRLTGSSE